MATAADPGQLSLEWRVQRVEFAPRFPDGQSVASLTLGNRGRQPWPAQGWSLYFSTLAGLLPASDDQPVLVEPVLGTLYRVRPRAGFPVLAPGAQLTLTLRHPEVVLNTTKAPAGPYIAWDDGRRAAAAVGDFHAVAPSGEESVSGTPVTGALSLDATALYDRYSSVRDLPPESVPVILPSPLKFVAGRSSLRWRGRPPILADAALVAQAGWLGTELDRYFPAARGAPRASATPAIELKLVADAGQDPERYRLSVDAERGVRVESGTARGVSRAIASLLALMPSAPARDGSVSLAGTEIEDAPRFGYRGLMIDVARNFHGPETLKHVLDLMARVKLNVLHLHLTDDEGWRIAIAGLPELTDYAARRGHSADESQFLLPAYGSAPLPGTAPGSGFFTRAQFIDLLRYADARGIEVVPEIEMPGHARAAVKAMQARARRLAAAGAADAEHYLLSDPGDHSVYESAQGYHDNLMNPGAESTYAFIEQVVGELASMYGAAGLQLRLLHVGADEVPAGAWSASPQCAALMQREGLTDIPAVWDYFYDRVLAILARHGVAPGGWEELGSLRTRLRGQDLLVPGPHFVNRRATLYVWNNLGNSDELGYRLANAGYDVVLSPATRLYFDMAAYRGAGENGVNWAAYTDLDTVFDYLPLDDLRASPTDPAPLPGRTQLTDFGRAHVRGIEATLFAETIVDREHLDFLLMPRLLALAERAWAADPAWARASDPAEAQRLHGEAWSTFANQLGKRVLPALDAAGLGGAYRIAPPGARVSADGVQFNQQLPGFTLRVAGACRTPLPASGGRAGGVQSGDVHAKGAPCSAAVLSTSGRAGRSTTVIVP